ncbi:immunoglobulin I-set domain protein [Ancylostoma ceylanicum]|uniref:Immunoglobulin I-set domain protein n=1 Tax=Ancylostoma ceylanicum TaxID=53326 RepID=A0A0D6M847_9BILA|nr:immunoglobulin I-set domain protein [Ancylostoma ceylanicum]
MATDSTTQAFTSTTNSNFISRKQRLSIIRSPTCPSVSSATFQAEDAGRYSCIAENKPGRAEKDLVVSILKPPLMETRFAPKEVQQSHQLTLQCPIDDPTVEFFWTKNGIPITTSDKVQISVRRDKLYLMDAEPSDSAQYACIARNEAGEDQSVFDTIVNGLTTTNMSLKVLDNHKFHNSSRSKNPRTIIPLRGCDPEPDCRINLRRRWHPSTNNYVVTGWESTTPNRECTGDFLELSCECVGVSPRAFPLARISRNFSQVFCENTNGGKILECHVLFVPFCLQFVDNGRVLVLNHVQSEEEGRYTCKAENKAGKAEADTYVQVTGEFVAEDCVEMCGFLIQNVLGRFFWEWIFLAVDFFFNPGNGAYPNAANSSGYVFGNPPPKVEWLKNGQLFQSELLQSSTNLRYLHLREASVEDAGRYTCIAMNRAGEQRASTQLHVLVIPVIEDGERVIQVKENNTLSIDCAAGGIPPPQITWKKDGQPLDDVQGGRLTVPHATASDAGRYTCTARNEAGHVSADFAVDVFSRPRFKDIKTEVQVIDGDRARLECKVEGHPAPTVRWLRGGRPIEDMSNFILSPRGETLMILKARRADAGSYSCVAKNAAGESEAGFTKEDEGRYTCHAFNEAGVLDTDYESEVIAPPKFHRTGESVYEVVEHETVTLDCAVATEPKPEVIWYRGEQPLYLAGNMALSPDAMVLVPPKIDKSNIIGNPLAIVERNIYLECPVSGIPQPTVSWTKDGNPVDVSDSRIVFAQNNQTFGIEGVRASDQARYTCIASNKGGSVEQDFNLEVLTPPALESTETQAHTKREGDALSITCPIRSAVDATSAVSDVSWIKDGRPIERENNAGVKVSLLS